MDAILSISIDFQIVLIAGYLGYKVATVGRGINHSTEEFLAQLLVFGSISRAGAFAVELAARWTGSNLTIPTVSVSADARTLWIALVTVGIGIACGVVWRRNGIALVGAFMRITGTHLDDHEPTAWASIRSTKATWTFIQVHLKSGSTLESVFDRIPTTVPGGPFTIADDGVSIYVTKIHKADGTSEECSVSGPNGDSVATYIPRDNINQVDFGWR